MIAGSSKNITTHRVLTFLLCILQWLVICQERLARILNGSLQYLSSFCRNILPHKHEAKKRGNKPRFPSRVAVILTEDWAESETLDNLATLIHW